MVGDSITSIVAAPTLYWWKLYRETAEAALSGITFLDSGVGGQGTPFFSGADQFEQYVVAKSPTVMIVMLGVNDYAYTAAQFRGYYDILMSRAFAAFPTMRIALAGPWRNTGDGDAVPPADAHMNELRDVVLDVGLDNGVTFWDIRQYNVDHWSPFMTVDFVHPAATGSAQMSEVAIAGTVFDTTQGFPSGHFHSGARKVG